ncbi:hypothetical protein QQ020_01460 [Fulvivirgaceae bacterium BMA12]|uniref:DUF3108 domain-containing protein n=1 Tax=Agaribacillus aureus TaxID=3051825 RepID=A0ABT8KYW6_9BACT|nr:hypothetical protein [Fulvivirgaceae bacterium BMA12]
MMMKFKITLLLLIGIASVTANAQDCSRYYPFKEGAEFELSSYNKKGKVNAKSIYKVMEVSNGGGAETAFIANEIFDEKGKSALTMEYKITCKDDIVSVDFSNLIAPTLRETYKEMEFEMSGENLQLPNNLSTGQSLPDAHAIMSVHVAPVNMKMRVDITDRQVALKEKVTTGAGTFDCYLITYKTILKNQIGINQASSSKQWIAEKVGVVKQEDYNGKGKLLGRTELTAIRGL